MKKPDEIKKGLERCMNYQSCTDCGEPKCPKNDVRECVDTLLADALAYIKQLEADKEHLGLLRAVDAEAYRHKLHELERSLLFARNLADGLKAATVKQEQELYVSEERNRQLEAQNAELMERLQAKNKRIDELTDFRTFGRGNY